VTDAPADGPRPSASPEGSEPPAGATEASEPPAGPNREASEPGLGPALAEVTLAFAVALGALALLAPVMEARGWGGWRLALWLLPPVALAAIRREDGFALLGLTPGRRTPRGLLLALGLSVTVLPLYAVGKASWLAGGAALPSIDAGEAARVFGWHLVTVALYEEAFFRGYATGRLLGPGEAPSRARLLAAFVVPALLFGIAHAVLLGDPTRMDTALPALLFCLLRVVGRDIWGAVAFHAACNAIELSMVAS